MYPNKSFLLRHFPFYYIQEEGQALQTPVCLNLKAETKNKNNLIHTSIDDFVWCETVNIFNKKQLKYVKTDINMKDLNFSPSLSLVHIQQIRNTYTHTYTNDFNALHLATPVNKIYMK